MENIFLPSKIEYKKGDTPNQARLIIEPLFHGYGTTIGNALRRVLLSSLPGAAVTSLKIKGATHEFTSVEGVYEDVLEIVLNLKQLRLKCYSEEPIKLKVTKKGEGPVAGKDIEKNSDVEIINEDLVIATVTDKSKEFNMDIIVEQGLGFLATENRSKENLDVGAIAIDALFSPVINVGYVVEDTRVGQITNYDKVTLTIETDGTITPEQAVSASAKILMDHFALLNPQEIEMEKPAKPAPKKPAAKKPAAKKPAKKPAAKKTTKK